ncbi:MAG: ABC transporter permease [Planctomycetota bacterium]|nr:MAG: ABC transporter permease [Planctomycetota bacterium]
MTMAERQNNIIESLGLRAMGLCEYLGGLTLLLGATAVWTVRSLARPRWRDIHSLSEQVVRVGIRSVGIVALVQGFIGAILALQLVPTLEQYGQESQVAAIIGIGGFRMLGPIFTAVVLSGFAGASIAAELGTMVVAEEIEALEAMSLPPVRFLVVPRVLATFIVMLLLTTFADLMIALGGYLVSRLALGPAVYLEYWQNMRDTLEGSDYVSGLVQGGVFGVLLGLIACFEGLKVKGGAQGVGKATTMTVVNSIVAIVLAACVCTIVFYLFKL